jgi:hypothetical protein
MSSIEPKEFDDDLMLLTIIKNFLQKDQYRDMYLYLDDYLKKNHIVTAKDIQKKFFIFHYSRAFQLLESFCIFNLLKKKKRKGTNQIFFARERDDLWKYLNKSNGFKKEDGTKKTSE